MPSGTYDLFIVGQSLMISIHIKRIGTNIILVPKDDPWAALVDSLDRFSDDFMSERVQPELEDREQL